MGELYDHKYAERLMAKWALVLEAGPAIENDQVKLTTAMVLENTEKDFRRQGLITEADGMVAQGTGGIAGAADPTAPASNGVLGANDFHWPSIVIPMVRRIFPSLISHEIVGVQPMNGPIGFAFAFRARYGANGILGDGSLDLTGAGSNNSGVGNGGEIGYNYVDSRYTGTSGTDTTATSTSFWQSYAGTTGQRFVDGLGQSTGVGEYNNVNDKYPMAKFELIKQAVEAKTRKLAANWSPELAEDMMAMHGIDVEAEMLNILTYEIAAEIDRQLLNEQVKVAITGGKTSIWDAVSADGRNQIERIGTLLTQLNLMSNKIAETTRRGSANFCIGSTRVTSVLQRLNAEGFIPVTKGGVPSLPNSGVGSLIKVGLINGGAQLLIRDTFAGGDYAMLGYKGAHQGDSGVVYCPYVPVQMMKAVRTDNFTPEVGARTRYGVLNNVWGSANYFQFVQCANMSGVGLSSDQSGTRQFTFA